MDEKDKVELDKNFENNSKKDVDEIKDGINVKKLLNVLLSIIVFITLGCGAVFYYSIYQYTNKEILNETNTTENVATIADMINTAIEPSNNTVNQVSNVVSTSNTTVSTEDADSRKVLNQEIIVLYDGLILEAK